MGKKRKKESWKWARRPKKRWANETGSVERRCVGSFSVEAGPFWRSLRACLSDCEPEARVDVCVVPDVTDVLVSPSPVVTEFCDGFFVLL